MIEIKELSYYRNDLKKDSTNKKTANNELENWLKTIENPILSNINLELAEQRIAIIGANGSGKSSLTKMFNGLLTPTQGEVFINQISATQSVKLVRKLVGYIFQNAEHQIIFPTVYEDLSFGLKNLKLPANEIDLKIIDILKQYNLLHLKDSNVDNLSGGEKQLIAILGVLIMQPEILIFDEPTTLLDLRNKNRLLELVLNMSQQIIFVTHDLELLDNFDRTIVLDFGQVVFDGKPIDAVKYYRELVL